MTAPDPGRVQAVATVLQAAQSVNGPAAGTVLGRVAQLQLGALQLVARRVQRCLDDPEHYHPARVLGDVVEVLAALDVLLDEVRPAWAGEHEAPLPRMLRLPAGAPR